MKTKSLLMCLMAVLSLGFWSCSDDDENGGAAVGITSVTVKPEGSAKEYRCTPNQSTGIIENTSDSVDWDVTDASLTKTTVKVTATLNTVVYYNDQAIGADGLEIDVKNPVTLTAKDNSGNTKVYTLKVVRATTASGETMVKKSDSFQGLPSNLLSFDMAYFKDKFYAITTTVTGVDENKVENYQLFSSVDGLNWTEVAYQTDITGVNFTEEQVKDFVIGGEGARLVVFNDRMYVLGGARTQASDKFGNAKEEFYGMPQISYWRSFSTEDGLTFKVDTVGMTYQKSNGDVVSYQQLTNTNMNTAVFDGKLFMKSGYNITFGMGQNAQVYAYTSDGKAWNQISPVASDGSTSVDVARRLGDAFFAFKGKLWCVGGFVNFLSSSANNTCGTVYSSTDGISWTLESDTVGNVLKNLYGMKVVANDEVAYMFGGERLVGDGTYTREISQDIFRSTDGITWEKVEAPQNYVGRRLPSVLLQGNSAWIFGGIKSKSSDNYAFPSATDELATDTWVKLMN